MKTAKRSLLVIAGITVFVLAALLTAGCGDDTGTAADVSGGVSGAGTIEPGSASAVVEKYYTALMAGDCAAAYGLYYVDQSDPQSQVKIDSFIQDCEEEVAAAGPVEGSVQIASEEGTGDTAVVKVIINDSKTGEMQAVAWSVRKDNGEWKLTDA